MGMFDYLSQGVAPVQLPDPAQMMVRGLTLADLARRNRQGQEEEEEKRRARAEQEAYRNALPGLVQAGFSPEAIQAAINADPRIGGAVLKEADARRKARMDESKTQSEIDKNLFERRQKAAIDIANIAHEEAKNPNKLSLSRLQSAARFYDIDLPQPAEDETLGGYLSTLAAGGYNIKDRVSNEQTAARDKEAQTDRDLTRDQNWRIAGMNDARAREFNAAQRDQAAATRDAARIRQTGETEMKLADDYRTQSKGWQETATAIGKVNKALETATTNPGSALAAGTAFMKILDPNSVVRESELGMALNASGWFDRARNVAQTLQSGRVMTPTQAKNLQAAANALFEEAAATQRRIDAAFVKRTKDYGGDPSRVIIDLGQNRSPGGQSAMLKREADGSYTYTPNAR